MHAHLCAQHMSLHMRTALPTPVCALAGHVQAVRSRPRPALPPSMARTAICTNTCCRTAASCWHPTTRPSGPAIGTCRRRLDVSVEWNSRGTFHSTGQQEMSLGQGLSLIVLGISGASCTPGTEFRVRTHILVCYLFLEFHVYRGFCVQR